MPPSLTYFQKIWPENLGITVFISLDNRDQSTIVDSNIYMRNWWKLICWCFMTHVFCHAWHKVIYEILPYLSSSKSSIWRSEIPESTVVKKERWYCVKKKMWSLIMHKLLPSNPVEQWFSPHIWQQPFLFPSRAFSIFFTLLRMSSWFSKTFSSSCFESGWI